MGRASGDHFVQEAASTRCLNPLAHKDSDTRLRSTPNATRLIPVADSKV